MLQAVEALGVQCDVVVAGGGLVGLTCALAMSGGHLSTPVECVLLEQKPELRPMDAQADPRAYAITPSSKMLLQMLGVWTLLEDRVQPMSKIVVTDHQGENAERRGLLSFLGSDDFAPFAWLVEAHVLHNAVLQLVEANERIDVHTGFEIASFSRGPAYVDAVAQCGAKLRAKLLVAADGRNSRIRDMVGVETVSWQYGQSAIALTVGHEHAHNGVAYEHFRSAGPFASLPLTGNRSSIVWTVGTEASEKLTNLNDEEFLAELQRVFGNHLGVIRLDGPRAAWPLGFQIARRFVDERVALVGDAAHVIHPLAGLGLNLGLRDVAALTESVMDAVVLGNDFGESHCLGGYQLWRRSDTWITAMTCDGLNALFSNDNASLVALRKAGLAIVDRVAPAKEFFENSASGKSSDMPKLMRGESL